MSPGGRPPGDFLRVALVLGGLALVPSVATAGAWTQPAGAHYTKLWTRTLVGKGIFAADGTRTPIADIYADTNLQAYGELGLTDTVTLVGALTPLGFAAHKSDQTVYVGPSVLGVRVGTAAGNLRLAGELRAGGTPPVGDVELGGRILAAGGAYRYQPVVAGARVEAEAQLGGPTSFGWWVVSPGARWRTEATAEWALLTFAQLGWSISERWTADLHASIVEPLRPRSEPHIANASGAGWTRYQGFGAAGTRWWRPEWGVQVGIEGVVTAMSNAETPTLVLGVEHKSR